jgi:hypothetical protein
VTWHLVQSSDLWSHSRLAHDVCPDHLPERLATRREQAARDEQYKRDRKTARDTFLRDSILALQAAISDLIRAVYQELDRILAEFNQTGHWPARQWETPTAAGWSDAVLRLELARARVFDDQLRSLATELRTLAGNSIWAGSLAAAKAAQPGHRAPADPGQPGRHDILPSLY